MFVGKNIYYGWEQFIKSFIMVCDGFEVKWHKIKHQLHWRNTKKKLPLKGFFGIFPYFSKSKSRWLDGHALDLLL